MCRLKLQRCRDITEQKINAISNVLLTHVAANINLGCSNKKNTLGANRLKNKNTLRANWLKNASNLPGALSLHFAKAAYSTESKEGGECKKPSICVSASCSSETIFRIVGAWRAGFESLAGEGKCQSMQIGFLTRASRKMGNIQEDE